MSNSGGFHLDEFQVSWVTFDWGVSNEKAIALRVAQGQRGFQGPYRWLLATTYGLGLLDLLYLRLNPIKVKVSIKIFYCNYQSTFRATKEPKYYQITKIPFITLFSKFFKKFLEFHNLKKFTK